MARSSLKGKRVLITGASGFIGANLLRESVNQGAQAFIFVRKDSNLWRIRDILSSAKKIQVDLGNPRRLKNILKQIRPQIILHAAAYGTRPEATDFKRIIEANLKGTASLLDCCLDLDFELFVNTGSSSEYGIKKILMREKDSLNPATPYGISKAIATLYAQNLARIENKPIVTLRLFSPYGYYEAINRLIPAVIISCLKKEDISLSSAASVRDFVFIEDVMSAYKKAYERRSEIKGEIFNIGSGLQYTVGDIVSRIIKLTNSKIRLKWSSLDSSRIEPKHWQADIRKAREQLHWQPAYSLDKGLSRTIDWFKKNRRLYC